MSDSETSGIEPAGDASNRLSSIMDMEYESKVAPIVDEDVEDDKKPAPSDEQPKEKKKASKSKGDSDDEDESEEGDDKEEEKEVKEEEKKKIKYKVDGQEEEIEATEEDIKSALSAKSANLKKLNELNVEKKQWQAKIAESDEAVNYVKQEMGTLRGEFEKGIETFKKNGVNSGNPLSPIYNLLDKMGLDTASFDKAALFYFLPMAEKFSALSDEGKELFLSRHENEWHKRKQSSLEKQRSETAEQQRKFQEESSELRKANISSELRSELEKELADMGVKSIDHKKVIEWNQVKPTYLRAQGIAEKVPGTNTNKIARILLEFPDTTDEEILNHLGFKDLEKDTVSRKLAESKPKGSQVLRKSEDKIEEEVDNMFKTMFRR